LGSTLSSKHLDHKLSGIDSNFSQDDQDQPQKSFPAFGGGLGGKKIFNLVGLGQKILKKKKEESIQRQIDTINQYSERLDKIHEKESQYLVHDSDDEYELTK